MTSEVLIIILSLFFSAFFSGMEIAFISSNKIHIEIEKKQGGFLSKLLSKITAKPSKFIATMLIGNNIALVVYGLYMGDLLVAWFSTHIPNEAGLLHYFFDELSLLTQTIISTLVILVTAEFLPKVFFSNIRQYATEIIGASSLCFLYRFFIFFKFCDLDIRFGFENIF
jgi:CBS domain containing-hemolysin-like protein